MAEMNDFAAPQMSLRDYLAVIRRRQWVLIVMLVVAVAATVISTLLQTPMYRASADILVRQSAGLSGGSQAAATPSLANEVRLAESQEVRETLAELIGFSPQTSVRAASGASVLTFTAESTNPLTAATIANTHAEVYIDYRRSSQVADYLGTAEVINQRLIDAEERLREIEQNYLRELGALGSSSGEAAEQLRAEFAAERAPVETQLRRYIDTLDSLSLSSDLAERSGTTIINPAAAPSSPFSPDLTRNIATALIVALVLGIGLVFLLDYFDDRVKTKAEFELLTPGLPTLAVVPRLRDWKNMAETHIVSFEQPRSPAAEAYRSLRTSVAFLGVESPFKTLQITSPRMRDGKSTTAVNLAVAMTRAGNQRVLLIDADLRRPRIHKFFGLDNAAGLSTVLLGATSVSAALERPAALPDLDVLTSGPGHGSMTTELFTSRLFRELLEGAADRYDRIIIDTPPLMSVADPLVVAGVADAVMLVVGAGNTTAGQLRSGLESLHQVGANLIGTVLNSFDARAAGYYSYSYNGYGYGYGYGYNEAYGTDDLGEPTTAMASAGSELVDPNLDPSGGSAAGTSAVLTRQAGKAAGRKWRRR
jgi:capsular exopolysaccharide synthesis family protein